MKNENNFQIAKLFSICLIFANFSLALLIKKGVLWFLLDINRITDSKNLWRVFKPNFSNKVVTTNRVILRDGGRIIPDTEKVTDTFNTFFVNIGNTLKIDKDKGFLVETNDVFDPVLKVIKKYSSHFSILNIKEKINNYVASFWNVTYEEIPNEWTICTHQSKIMLILLPVLSYKPLIRAL